MSFSFSCLSALLGLVSFDLLQSYHVDSRLQLTDYTNFIVQGAQIGVPLGPLGPLGPAHGCMVVMLFFDPLLIFLRDM